MTERYMDGGYLDANPTWHAEDAPWKAGHVSDILSDNQINFSTLLEVGCGTGQILLELSRSFPGATFYGYDVSPQAIDIAKESTGQSRVEFHLDDPLNWPDKPDRDVALVADVIEHVEDPFSFTRRVRELAKWKVFHIPLDLSVQSVARIRPILNLRAEVGHIHYFTKDTALALLADCGYSVHDVRYTASRLELPNQALSSKLMSIPRRLSYRLQPDLAVRILGGYSLLVLAT